MPDHQITSTGNQRFKYDVVNRACRTSDCQTASTRRTDESITSSLKHRR